MANFPMNKGQQDSLQGDNLQSPVINTNNAASVQQTEAERARKAEISKKRAEAGRKGGKAAHKCRGLGCADELTRKSVSSKGGSAPHKSRGRQSKKSFN